MSCSHGWHSGAPTESAPEILINLSEKCQQAKRYKTTQTRLTKKVKDQHTYMCTHTLNADTHAQQERRHWGQMDFYILGFNRTTVEKTAARDGGGDWYKGGRCWCRECQEEKNRVGVERNAFWAQSQLQSTSRKLELAPLHWQCQFIHKPRNLKVTTFKTGAIRL